ncbi:hypothetical protein Q9S71_10950 [Microbacterium sp. KSW4-11]|uniref:DUF600 family protein n=2 Tax=Microbacterium TaxID=33882 RepID=A0A177KE91_9MICO|nr:MULTISPECIES: hypothetical protein [Microbacterium]MDT3317336.1 hypothetical protein [Microbacterium sp. KSW4-11]OAH51387.1 hypothetical protein AYL44_03745 [Microbacterium oleivorans]
MSTDPTTELIRAIVTNMQGARDDWKSLAMVISLGGGRLSETSGYAYSPDGTVSAVASRPSQIKPAVDAYLADRYPEGAELPAKFLLQFDRDAKAYEITFEDTDPMRWKVTPDNFEAIRQELKPNLG